MLCRFCIQLSLLWKAQSSCSDQEFDRLLIPENLHAVQWWYATRSGKEGSTRSRDPMGGPTDPNPMCLWSR